MAANFDHYRPDIEAVSDNRSAQVINVESPAKYVVPLVVIACAASLFALGYTYFAFTQMTADLHETRAQAWLTERRLLDMETYATLNGWRVPKDQEHGPMGNLERMSGKEKANARK